MGQRQDVAGKYEGIYGQLCYVADAILSDDDIPARVRYQQLKNTLPAYWTALTQLRPGETIVLPPPLEILGRALQLGAEPAQWRVRDVTVSGTAADYSRAMDSLAVDTLRRHVPAAAELVFDLGCGWGHRMFDAYLAGIAPAAKYWGGDRSQASRFLVERIHTLFPDLRAGWFPFDFLHPDFDIVPGSPREVCLFTCHAIEQVTRIGTALFDRILARFPDSAITGIHLEPVTFQLEPGAHGNAADVNYAYAKQRDYNLDLVAQLRGHPRIEMIASETGVLDRGGGNATSILIWKRRGA